MNKDNLLSFYSWFDDYVNTFYSADEDIQKNILLKKEHTKRVCAIMKAITSSIELKKEETYIAETTALFHDIGRFEQYKRYQTFVDHKSVDHAKLGAHILRETGILSILNESEQYNIIKAIEYHNIRTIPSDEAEDCLLYSKLIRDADKLDIYNIIVEYLKEAAQNPNKALEVYPRTNKYSSNVITSLQNKKCVDYRDLKTFFDRRLLEISWVFDINFSFSLSYVKEKGYIDYLFKELPSDSTINHIREIIYNYIGK